MKTFTIDGEKVKITTKPSNARKSIDIEFKPGEIILEIPRGRQVDVETLLERRRTLIVRKYREAAEKINLLDSDSIYFAGEPRKIETKRTPNPPDPRIHITQDTLTIHYREQENPLELLKQWITHQTEQLIQETLEKQEERLGFLPKNIRIQYTPRWGQCTKKGYIAYNWQLSTLPPELSEYVIIHEAIHLKHHHHLRDFHRELEKILPNHRQLEKELQRYTAIPPDFPYKG